MNPFRMQSKARASHVVRAILCAAAVSLLPGPLLAEEPGAAKSTPAGERLKEQVVRVGVHPESIELTRRFAYRQLVVTGVLEDGRSVDLTRDVRVANEVDLVSVDERGRVMARKNGQGKLELVVDEFRLELPLNVQGVDRPLNPDYIRDVQPILSKLGCNSGTCHGSAKGKNGFKLSLRGNDYEFDHRALTDDHSGRRFNRAAPERSLFLTKPTGLAPHEGGVLMQPGDPYYEVLRAWVADGVPFNPDAQRVSRIEIYPRARVVPLPGMKQQMSVVAHFADGSQRDVTSEAFIETNNTEVTSVGARGLVTTLRRGEAAILARYEGNYSATQFFVMGDRSEFAWEEVPEYNRIDTLVYQKHRRFKIQPSDVCTDAEFLRRACLDLIGLPPTVKQVRVFLEDQRDSRRKREELVDRLIGSAEFVEHWTNKWADLLQVNEKFLGEGGVEAFRGWIHRAVASNMPYDQFAYQLIAASGSTLENPAASYYRPVREPDAVMENTTQLFLGVRFNCNKCHDHPFERWTQAEHWELAAFFARVGRKGGSHGKSEEIIFDKTDGEVTAPYNNEVVAPSFPYSHEGDVPGDATRREKVARWLTARQNPYFARSYVNRIWSYFLGVGIIDPVDDIRASNPPTNPQLLDYLTGEFVSSGFDVRHLMRLICTSRTYQHSIETNRWNEDDDVNFSHALARRLPAETLYDAIHRVTGSTTEFPGVRRGTRAAGLPDPSVKTPDGFLDLFGRPPRESACECERTTGMSLGQALSLVNGPTVSEAIQDPNNDISDLVAIEKDPRKVVDELFLAILNRPPTDAERSSMVAALDPRDLANAEALEPADARAVREQFTSWESGRRARLWSPVAAGLARSAGGASFETLEDGSYLASGAAPEKDTYTIVGFTDATELTGLRLEVLPHDSLGKGKGPGRTEGGNFVLSELGLVAASAKDPTQVQKVVLQNARASFNQGNFDVPRAIDGKTDTGWAINGGAGRRQRAVFEFKDNVGFEGGTLLTLTLDQQHGGKHTLGRFRFDVTRGPRPVELLNLPDDVVGILRVDPAKRTEEQTARLFREFMGGRVDLADKIRLAAAQDVAWALINSPAFLFNR